MESESLPFFGVCILRDIVIPPSSKIRDRMKKSQILHTSYIKA